MSYYSEKDEAQFLTADEVLLLKDLSVNGSKNIICYGLKTDVNGNLFEGSSALLAHADNITEIPYLCQEPNCTEKANVIFRRTSSRFQKRG